MKKTGQKEGWRGLIRHWLKFNAVGAMGIIIQLTILTVLVSLLHVQYLLATFLAVETTILHNFLWHERWTWGERTRLNPGAVFCRLIRFNLTTGLTSLLGNLILMYLLVDQAGIHYLIANMISITSCSLINFLVSDQLIFRPPKKMKEDTHSSPKGWTRCK